MFDVVATAAAFLRDISTEPEDDGLRLIYADWLEENGQGERAEFIRIQISLANWPCECDSEESVYHPECRCDEQHTLLRRERELLQRACGDWLSALEDLHGAFGVQMPSGKIYHVAWVDEQGCLPILADFRRGFVESITLSCANFLDRAESLFRAAPITRVTLNDKEPAQSADGEWYWEEEEAYRTLFDRPADGGRLLPGVLLKLLWDGTIAWRGNRHPLPEQRFYATETAARAALSTACVRLGRQRAGLAQAPSGTRT